MPRTQSLPRDFDPAFDRLTEVTGFGSNPGALRMFKYVPADPQPALVVVLHGCTQTAASYDFGAGWSTLADRHGFVLLPPEQQPANNAVEVTEATVRITLKVPAATARMLRAYARSSGLTIGAIVTRALAAFLSAQRRSEEHTSEL